MVRDGSPTPPGVLDRRVPTPAGGCGRMRLSEETTATPTPAELAKAETPLDYGRLYGYSEDDIAHFYNRRRRGHQSGYEEYVRDLESSRIPGRIQEFRRTNEELTRECGRRRSRLVRDGRPNPPGGIGQAGTPPQLGACGRMRLSEETTATPTPAELAKAETPLDYGRLYGYSEDDIAHFYNRRRRGHQSGYEEYVRDLESPAFPAGYKSSGGPAKN